MKNGANQSIVLGMSDYDARHHNLAALHERRKQVIRLHKKQYGVMQIVELTQLSWSAVRAAIDLYEAGGMAALKPKPRGKKGGEGRSLTPDQEAHIRKLIVDQRPEQLKMDFALWTRAAVGELIAREFQITLSVRGVGKYLKRWGFTPQKPIRKAYEQSPEAVKRWMDEDYPAIAERAKAEGGEIHWGDETALVNTDVRGRGYAPKGETPVAYAPRVGDVDHVYEASEYLIVGIDLPVIGAVIKASADEPYLCFKLQLGRMLLAEMLPGARSERSVVPLCIAPATTELIDAAIRMLRLLDSPSDLEALAPLIEREILHRLLCGPQGDILRQIAVADSRHAQIHKVVQYLTEHFYETFSVEELAANVGMSPSSFYDHFRETTMMTPLQFRNHLRLQEVRRLMLMEGMNAAAAGFRVDYESLSQLSRDYARVYGMPPRQDAERLKRSLDAGAAIDVS